MAKRRRKVTKKRGRKVEQVVTTRDRIVFDAHRQGPRVHGERFAPGYDPEAAAYEQRTRRAVFTPTRPFAPGYTKEAEEYERRTYSPLPLRGYGSSSEVHTEEGAHAAGEASEYAVRSANLADQGDCNTARRFLNAAHGFIGHAVAHSKSGGSVGNITMATDTVDRAEKHYAARCPVKWRK